MGSLKHSFFTVLASLLVSSVATAGDLDPPAGPIQSTAKPLAHIEPRTMLSAQNTPGNATAEFVITQPGSYYLGSPVAVRFANRHVILVQTAGDVTIDLNGMKIASDGPLETISTGEVLCASLRIVNGRVGNTNVSTSTLLSIKVNARQFIMERVICDGGVRLNEGTFAGLASSAQARYSNCVFSSLGGILFGPNPGLASLARTIMVDCRADRVTCPATLTAERCVFVPSSGIALEADAVIARDCTFTGGGGSGIAAVNSLSAHGCVYSIPGGIAFQTTGAASVVNMSNCTAIDANFAFRFNASQTHVHLRGCSARGPSGINDTIGVQITGTGSSARLDSCVMSTFHAFGYDVGANAEFVDCVANNITGANWGLGSGATQGFGFRTGANAVLKGCSAIRCSGYGVSVGGSSSILRCTIVSDTGTGGGFRGTGTKCVVDECSSSALFGGFTFDASTVTRCRVTAGGTFTLTGTGMYGPVVTTQTALNTAGPWANIQY